MVCSFRFKLTADDAVAVALLLEESGELLIEEVRAGHLSVGQETRKHTVLHSCHFFGAVLFHYDFTALLQPFGRHEARRGEDDLEVADCE